MERNCDFQYADSAGHTKLNVIERFVKVTRKAVDDRYLDCGRFSFGKGCEIESVVK